MPKFKRVHTLCSYFIQDADGFDIAEVFVNDECEAGKRILAAFGLKPREPALAEEAARLRAALETAQRVLLATEVEPHRPACFGDDRDGSCARCKAAAVVGAALGRSK